jgi:hypothetical protein
MPTIIRRLPFVEQSEPSLRVPGGELVFLPDELIVWVSIIPPEIGFDPTAPHFPAVLDTGTNHNLVMRPDHFSNLAGFELSAQTPIRDVPIRGRSIEGATERERKATVAVPKAYDFTIYLYRNLKGERAPRLDMPPLEIEVQGGIVVTPDTWTLPPLPVLGTRAIRRAGLRLRIDAKQGLSVWCPRES